MECLVSIFTNHSYSPGLYNPYKKPLPNFLQRRMRVGDSTDISQSQTASDDRLLSQAVSNAGSKQPIWWHTVANWKFLKPNALPQTNFPVSIFGMPFEVDNFAIRTWNVALIS